MIKNITRTWRTTMELKENFTKRKYLRAKATEIHYNMHEIET
jgi:hypothetical protein